VSLTSRAIESNRVTAIAVLLVLILGIQTYQSMPRDEDPGFLIRVALVTTPFPGASPERVERLVTDRIETAARQIPEVDLVTSESREGISIVFVEVGDEHFDLQPIWDDLRRKIEAVQPDLPSGAGTPIVDDDYGDVFGILLSLTAPGFSERQLYEVAKQVRDEFLLLPDAARVEINGRQVEHIFLEYSNARLAEVGLSPQLLADTLAAQNIVVSGGSVSTGIERITLEPTGNFESVEELGETAIPLPNDPGSLVSLRDLVTVRRGTVDPPTDIRRATGLPALGLAISMREGGNLIELGRQVRETIDRLKVALPLGIEIEVSQLQPDIVSQKVSDFESNLVQSVVIVSLVMLLTLGLRTGLIVASLVPMAIVSAIAVMGAFSIGLDQMSLAALIIALGMLVDNAIVMSESIIVQMSEGKSPVAAAVDSAAELSTSLLTSSLTTAAAFLPIYLAENAAGEYTAPIFKVVTITLICSWFVALTMIPLLCVWFLRVDAKPGTEGFDAGFYQRYRGLLVRALHRPLLSLALMVGLLVLSLSLFRFVPNLFFPENDRPLMVAEFVFPFGTAIELTDAAVAEFEAFLESEHRVGADRSDGVTDWVTYVGSGGPRFTLGYSGEQPASYAAAMIINASSRDTVTVLAPRLEDWCHENLPGIKATVRPLGSGPAPWPPIQIQILGRRLDPLYAAVAETKAQLREIPGTRLVDDDWGALAKKLRVRVDQARARRAGLTSNDIAVSLQTELSGVEATEFREGVELIPITIRAAGKTVRDLTTLESINVYSQSTGTFVPLKQVADIEVVWEPGVIKRRNRLRTITIEAAPTAATTSADVVAALQPWLASRTGEWSEEISYRIAGENEDSGEANAAIQEKLPIAGLAIALLLVLQFNSMRKPAIILLTIPFALIGVVFGLLVARSYFGFMTLLGVISLAGIVINNAIVLIDRIQLEIDEFDRAPYEAILQAGQRRLRPILLTTATTVGGLIPLWLGGGPMFEPMAIAILFGLLFATVLTLVLVPVLYALFFRVREEPGAG